MTAKTQSHAALPLPLTPEEFERLTKEFMELNQEFQAYFAQGMKSGSDPSSTLQFLNFAGLSQVFSNAFQEILTNPQQMQSATEEFIKGTFELWQTSLQNMSGNQPLSPVITPAPGDRRFKDPLWMENPFSSFMMQSYLLYTRWMQALVDDLSGLDEPSRRKFKFYARQIVDAMAPSNFAWSNPSVIQKAMETKGQNLIRGMRKFLEDLKNGTSLVNIENTDRGAFVLGKDLATTPGKVIYQNKLMQLIQFEPSTEKVHKTPILVVPAWINKYYILDLRPKNSLVKWYVDQGYTVFIISWVNPGEELKDTNFEDYVEQGPLEALKVIGDITGEDQSHLVGFCLGGVSLTVMLGYLQKEAKERVKSLTLMASPLDFSQAGELTIFTDKDYMRTISSRMDELGLLDGPAMAATFNMLRANDLIWSAFINNYLLGQEQTQFDMLYWNADSTNLPGKMFDFYIQEMFLKNGIVNPGAMTVLGRKNDITKAEVPVFLFGAHDDHIAPWRSIYPAIVKFHGPVKFVLGASGHVAGVVNHPEGSKYGHWQNDDYTLDAESWLKNATYRQESWWLAWADWMKQFTGEQVDAKKRKPKKAIEDAPGTYVKVSAEEALRGI